MRSGIAMNEVDAARVMMVPAVGVKDTANVGYLPHYVVILGYSRPAGVIFQEAIAIEGF